jgi:sulfate/thiosulfate transport system substrate-binding protein
VLRLRSLIAPAAAVLAVVLVAGCGGTSSGDGDKLTLAAYSTPQEAYEQLVPAFGRTAQGRGTSFDQSFGPSGDQSRAVASGLPADVVAFSLAPDVDKLVEGGIVAKDWANDRYGGMVTNSVVVFAVRPGNPKNIRDWDDLITPGVEVVTPNPATSGGAKWNIMAGYGAASDGGRQDAAGRAYLRDLYGNITAQDKSARESLQTFTNGKGDVLIAYENEAITARHKGEQLDFVIPTSTILIENPVAVTTRSKQPGKAKAFVDFLRGEQAQRIFAEHGYRSVRHELVDQTRFPAPEAELLTIADLGGWSKVDDTFFDEENGFVTKIQQEAAQ